MDKINIGICDDEKIYVESMKKIIEDYFRNSELDIMVHVFFNGEDFINSKVRLDLLFLDIEMKEIDGISVKNILEKLYSKCKIVFVSNYDSRMIEAYGTNVIAFINKKNISDITIYLERIRKEHSEHKIISIGTHKIDAFDIVFIKADGSYSNVVGKTKKYLCCIYLVDILERLNNLPFVRVHRSYVVNLHYIRDIVSSNIILLTGEKIPISKTYKDNLVIEYFNYIRGI